MYIQHKSGWIHSLEVTGKVCCHHLETLPNTELHVQCSHNYNSSIMTMQVNWYEYYIRHMYVVVHVLRHMMTLLL